jgi:ABC-type transport system involved in multi-copper enzyme maturation permease subunit
MWYDIFKFEIQYRAKRLETYLYFIILFLFSIVAVDFLLQGTANTAKTNAPHVIAKTMAIVSALFMMLSSMIMGVAVLRDFEHRIESILFVKPITKGAYLVGRFLGSFVVLLFIFSALLFGMILGEFMPWKEANDLLPFTLWHYIQPFLYVVLPSLFFGGSVFFVSGAISRKLIVVYTQGVFFLVIYILAMVITRGLEDPFLGFLFDPFCFLTIDGVIQYWTPVEQNSLMLPVEGVLLYNRLLWVLIGIVVLVIGYFSFSFNVVRNGVFKKQAIDVKTKEIKSNTAYSKVKIPTYTAESDIIISINQLLQSTFFYFKSILKETSFWAIVLCAMIIIFINSINLGTTFGVDSYPRTYLIVEELQELSLFFFLIILIFFSGELIWKERDTKMDLIYDALPTNDFINLSGKFLGLLLTYVVLIFGLILSGILFQTTSGYYQYELGVYFMGFFAGIFPLLVLFSVVSFFFQVISNHKFMGHMLVVIFFIGTMILEAFGYNHALYKFGGDGLATYSDMNGYGHFLVSYTWVKLYWLSFGVILLIVSALFRVRGTETSLKTRWEIGKLRLTKPMVNLGVFAITVFVLSGGYTFYNINMLNDYFPPSAQEAYRANYEKTLKQYEYMTQPKIVDVVLHAELHPSERNYEVEGHFILENTHSEAIPSIHVQKMIDSQIELLDIKFEGGASIANEQEEYGYSIYELNKPLFPGDSIKMEFKQTFTTSGFVERGSNKQIIDNGTFFNVDHFPTFGYNPKYELRNNKGRENYGLAPRLTRAKRDDPRELGNARTAGDGYEINFEIVIGTDASQVALAPGKLQRTWSEEGRSYYHYKSNEPMINFYSIVSAEYEIKRDQWKPSNGQGKAVDLEIYYHEGHDYNLERMMNGMKKSFDYFSVNFSPYQYEQMRIMEFPRYAGFAQSFPNTVPYSESLGFIMDINDEEDVDMPFFVTAHELAHQWWGLQVIAANVQGRYMILESLAQYSALMVMKKEFPEEKLQQLLKREQKRYLLGRASATLPEMPLALVESSKYIHYGKGALSMYAFQDYVSEDSVNMALKRFIRDWNGFGGQLQTARYATTEDLLHYFREVTPDSLQYVIEDLFETITMYENKTTEAVYETLSANEYKVSLTVEAMKYRTDSLGVESTISTDDWIDIGVYAESEDGEEHLIYLEKHKITNQVTELEILVNHKPSKAGIDPLLNLIDINREDNTKELSIEEI